MPSITAIWRSASLSVLLGPSIKLLGLLLLVLIPVADVLLSGEVSTIGLCLRIRLRQQEIARHPSIPDARPTSATHSQLRQSILSMGYLVHQ